MPTLDQQGHIPEEIAFNRESWQEAARECGVDDTDVHAREAAEDQLNSVRDVLVAVVNDYYTSIGCELELAPWAEPEGISSNACEVSHVFAQFMVAAEEAREVFTSTSRQEGAPR